MKSPNSLHTFNQGQRVHYLTNLGGLVVLASLDAFPPDSLLGLLLFSRTYYTHLSEIKKHQLKHKGETVLKARQAEKRVFKAWQQRFETQRFDFTKAQMQALISRLGGSVDVNSPSSVLKTHLEQLIEQLP